MISHSEKFQGKVVLGLVNGRVQVASLKDLLLSILCSASWVYPLFSWTSSPLDPIVSDTICIQRWKRYASSLCSFSQEGGKLVHKSPSLPVDFYMSFYWQELCPVSIPKPDWLGPTKTHLLGQNTYSPQKWTVRILFARKKGRMHNQLLPQPVWLMLSGLLSQEWILHDPYQAHFCTHGPVARITDCI